MQRVVLEQRLGFVATVASDGAPNLSPKGTTSVWDDEHLFFAHIASPRTVENLRTNPRVEVNVVDPIERRGYRFRGTAEVHSSGPVYDRGLDVLEERGYTTPPQRIKGIVLIRVTHAEAVISPAYDDGATTGDVSERWLAHFNHLHGAAP